MGLVCVRVSNGEILHGVHERVHVPPHSNTRVKSMTEKLKPTAVPDANRL